MSNVKDPDPVKTRISFQSRVFSFFLCEGGYISLGSGTPEILTTGAAFDNVTSTGVVAGALSQTATALSKRASFAYLNSSVTGTYFNGVQLDWAFTAQWLNIYFTAPGIQALYAVDIYIGCNFLPEVIANTCYINFIFINRGISPPGDDYLRAGINIPNGCKSNKSHFFLICFLSSTTSLHSS